MKIRAAELEKKRREYKNLLAVCNQKEKEYADFLQNIEKIKTSAGEFSDFRSDELSAKYKEAELTLTRKNKLSSDIAALKERKKVADSAFAEAEKAAGSAKKAVDVAEKELAAARENLSRATLEEGADAIKKGLHAGDVCPVCGEVLKADPVSRCTHLKEAEEKAAECEKRAAACRKDYTEKAAAAAAIKESREQLFARLCECEKDAAALPSVDENEIKRLKSGLDAVVSLEKSRIAEQKIAAELTKLKAECDLLLKRGVEDKRDYDERSKRLSITDETALANTIALTEKNIKAIEVRAEEFDKCEKKAGDEKLELRAEKAEIAEKRKNLQQRLNVKIDPRSRLPSILKSLSRRRKRLAANLSKAKPRLRLPARRLKNDLKSNAS